MDDGYEAEFRVCNWYDSESMTHKFAIKVKRYEDGEWLYVSENMRARVFDTKKDAEDFMKTLD